jgi:hypothetical protein
MEIERSRPVARSWRSRVRALSGLLLGAWLFALALVTASHLAHHLLDERGASACEFLGAADHGPGIVGAPTVANEDRLAHGGPADRSRPTRPTAAILAAASRAPPPVSPHRG